MSSIAVAKLSMRFQSANQRPACKNCAHVREDLPSRADLAVTWHCTKGGFMTSAMALCSQHERRTPKIESVVTA